MLKINYTDCNIGGFYGLSQKIKGTQNQKRIYSGTDCFYTAYPAGTVQ